MLALSQDFLSARSRTPGIPLQLVLEPCRPAEVLRQAVDGVRPLATERLVTVTLDAHTDVAVDADPLRLRQVVDNLLTNAVKYNRYDGSIDVVLDDAEGTRSDASEDTPSPVEGVRIQVTDTGHGMSAEELESLFTRFYRTAGARDSGVDGTGLGLNIARDIVQAHGGTIDIASAPDQGTTVTVWLPRSVASGEIAHEVAS
jgi:signal transduction histidine kinase